jgi:hypothetical protein
VQRTQCGDLDRAIPGTFHSGCRFRSPTHIRRSDGTEARQQGNLIGSDKVEGTAVYGADRTKIGSIERVMIDKQSGKVPYAVLSFGGFLGIGDDHYPLPLAIAQVRHLAWRLHYRRDRNAAQGRTEIRQRQCLELGRRHPHPRRQRLLRHRNLIRLVVRQKARHYGGPFRLEGRCDLRPACVRPGPSCASVLISLIRST